MLDRIPLEAFRVFDAACRMMNFSSAGRSLNITQAAVSRRIKGLEDELGAQLFTRRGRNLGLTPDGERLARRVRATLEYLEESLEPFRSDGVEPLTLTASGSVSHLWLGRRLQDFSRRHPEIALRLQTSDSPADLSSEANDLVILYSNGAHPRWHLTRLMKEVLAPVASPDYLTLKGLDPAALSLAEIASLDLIDYERFNAHWLPFRQWFQQVGATGGRALPRPKLSFSTYALAIDAACQGQGVALGSLELIADHVRDGRLVTLGAKSLVTGFGYDLGLPRQREPRAEARILAGFLSGAK